MKKNVCTVLLLALLTGIVYACKDEEFVIKQTYENQILTRNSDIFSDEYKSQQQSNPESMLIDQIIYRDSIYVLNLNKDEATDLNISDSLYDFYYNIVLDLNKSTNETN